MADDAPDLFPCTLVFVSPHGTSPNNPDADPMSYVRQAVTLSRSLAQTTDQRLTIFTNEPQRVETTVRALAGSEAPLVAELPVRTELAVTTPFYGAHFKLDLIEHLASRLRNDQLAMMLDSDMVAMRPLDPAVLARCARTGLGVYDITAQVVTVHGAARIFADLERLAGRELDDPRWFGGELLVGRPGQLGLLATAARETFANYVGITEQLSHQGDEVFVSAAIDGARRDLPVVELGAHQVVARHWSGVPMYSLDWLRACSLLHLPGEKPLLESWASRDFDPVRFFRQVARLHAVGSVKWRAAMAIRRRNEGRAETAGVPG